MFGAPPCCNGQGRRTERALSFAFNTICDAHPGTVRPPHVSLGDEPLIWMVVIAVNNSSNTPTSRDAIQPGHPLPSSPITPEADRPGNQMSNHALAANLNGHPIPARRPVRVGITSGPPPPTGWLKTSSASDGPVCDKLIACHSAPTRCFGHLDWDCPHLNLLFLAGQGGNRSLCPSPDPRSSATVASARLRDGPDPRVR